MLQRNFAKVVSLRYRPLLVRTSLLGDMLESGWLVHTGFPSRFHRLLLPSSRSFYRLGRVMRVVLPLGTWGVAHLFVICGYQGSGSDPDKCDGFHQWAMDAFTLLNIFVLVVVHRWQITRLGPTGFERTSLPIRTNGFVRILSLRLRI